MNILVTGGAGFIGSQIVDDLIQAGHDVHILDNLSTGHNGICESQSCFSSRGFIRQWA